VGILNTILEIFTSADDEVEATICLPDYATTINASIKSPGFGQTAFLFANNLACEKIASQSYWFAGEPSEYIENYQ